MYTCVPYHFSVRVSELNVPKIRTGFNLCRRDFKVFSSSSVNEASNYVPAAPSFLPECPWKQIPGGVTAAKGFKAAGMYGGLRARGEKPDLALVTCDVDAIFAGAFPTNVAAPVLYCKEALDISKTARAVLINVGQANALTGDAGDQYVIECANALAMLLDMRPEDVLIASSGVIRHRIKEALLNSLPKLVTLMSSTIEGANSAAVAITTTDLVSKSVAVESNVGGIHIRVGGMAKGSGMIHPNMATMLGVVTTDAVVTSDTWSKMVQVAVSRSFNQITVDEDTSSDSTVIALASGLSGSTKISSLNSCEAKQLQACLDAVMVGLAKSIAWDGEGATSLIEVTVSGADSEADAAKIARFVASSSRAKDAVYRGDPNCGHIAYATGKAKIPYNPNKLRILLGDILLMDYGQTLLFDSEAASNYLRNAGETHGTVGINISIGDGPGIGQAWGQAQPRETMG